MPTISDIKSSLSIISENINTPEAPISELLFDSRRLLRPDKTLFFAIKTEKNDGHDFIPELIAKGVRNFIITENLQNHNKSCNYIVVKDCVSALQQIATVHRKLFAIPVVGITGSNGKTIVKEWLTQMLSEDYHLIASPNSYNSQIGVPISVWQMRSQHNFAIFEAGISMPGEMQKLEAIIQPTIGILTNIGSAHSQFFKDEYEKLNEKIQLFKNCKTIIYCNDNPLIEKAFTQSDFSKAQKLSWGHQENSYFRITQEVTKEKSTCVTLAEQDFEIPFTDAASIENALHTIVLLLHLNFTAEEINHKLQNLSAIHMRMEVKEAENQCIVINDTYSLDFNSLRLALDFLKSQIRFDNKTVILSDFAQIGKLDDDDYLEINQLLKSNGISKFIGVGPDFCRHQQDFEIAQKYFFPDTDSLLNSLSSIDLKKEAILLKGARSFAFERVVDALQLRSHKTILSVSLPALINNLNYYRSWIPPHTKVVAMVKAMCYGLGDVELINELQYHNIDYLAVAYTDEGVNLRKKNIHLPIIVLGAEAESFEMMINYRLEPEIFNFYSLNKFQMALASHTDIQGFKIHLKIDTGMHRLGFREEEINEVVKIVKNNAQLKIASIFSHFAAAEDEEEDAFTLSQISYFQEVTDKIQAQFNYPILRHIANTAGITRFPQAHFDMVRIGIGLYGFCSVAQDKPHLQHVATLTTVLTHIREVDTGETVGYNRTYTAQRTTKVGIIPIGYADGFPPELGRGVGSVIVHNQRVPIIGKICMDMTMIDLTEVKEVNEGDEVIVYGDDNRIDDIAAKIGKIPYHLLTAISKRVQRTYVMD